MPRAAALVLLLAAPPAGAQEVLGFEAPSAALALTAAGIDGAVARVGGDGRALVSVRLVPPAAQAFAALTARIVGERLRLSVCGRPRLEAVVRAPIPGGVMVFPAATLDEAQHTAAILRGEEACPDG